MAEDVAGFTVRPAEECRYDLVSLGEVMLRLDRGGDSFGACPALS